MGFANPRGGFQTDPVTGEVPRFIKVTSLADTNDPGTLRHAVNSSGPRVVVFEVSGVINLVNDLTINNPYITIAGQTAPHGGISLHHERLLIKSHDVVVEHIRVRPGDRRADGSLVTDPNVAQNRDGIGIGTGVGVNDITIKNCSVSWSLDALVDTWFPAKRVNIENCLLAEPLAITTHPDTSGGVPHNYALGIGYRSHDVSVVGNLFAHADRRNPRFGRDCSVVILNNTIYNSGHEAIHAQDTFDRLDRNTKATVVGNHLKSGPDTLALPSQPRWAFRNIMNGGDPEIWRLHHARNTVDDSSEDSFSNSPERTQPTILASPPVWSDDLVEMTAEDRYEHSLYGVGARPWDRDSVDNRVILAYASGTGGFINSQDEVGGYPTVCENSHTLAPPMDVLGDENLNDTADGIEWLNQFNQ